jgi:hypothetical protein
MLIENLLNGLANSQLFQDQMDGDARSGDDRLAHHHFREGPE